MAVADTQILISLIYTRDFSVLSNKFSQNPSVPLYVSGGVERVGPGSESVSMFPTDSMPPEITKHKLSFFIIN